MKKMQTMPAVKFCSILSKGVHAPSLLEVFDGKITKVRGNVELPPNVERLPDGVIFLHDFKANGLVLADRTCKVVGKLKEFNHVVKGRAAFLHLRKLRRFGPKTRFHGALNIVDCPLTSFNHPVGGDATFNNERYRLRSFGPRCRFSGNLDARGTMLTRFNHEVFGYAEFTGLKTLKAIGPKAKFHNEVYLKGTHIKEPPRKKGSRTVKCR